MFRNETETTGQQNITVRKYFHTQQQQQNYFFLRWISYVVHLLKHDDKQELFLRIGFVSEMIRLSLAWTSETKYMFVCLFFFLSVAWMKIWSEWEIETRESKNK